MKKTKTKLVEKTPVILHGECMCFPSVIPAEATELAIEGEYLIVAPSEVVGNHHVVDGGRGIKFFEFGARKFMQSTKPTKLRCLHKKRHDDITLPAGTFEFGSQQEYDPFDKRLRNVAD